MTGRPERNLYGTLFHVFITATHVVCPICGKSSSIRSFPAGGGTDIVLQTFQGLGRGKGFSVVSRESGLDDRKLVQTLRPKLLELLAVFAAHGHALTAVELAALGVEARPPPAENSSDLTSKIRTLEAELRAERKTREFVETEVTDLQTGLTKLLRQWRDEERRAAISQRQLAALRDQTERLVAATREGVESLQKLRADLKGSTRAERSLASHVAKMRAVVEAVQTLRASQKEAPPPAHREVTSRDSAGRRA